VWFLPVPATSGDQTAAPVQITVFADLDAMTESTETTGVAELEPDR
jgi:hypothetical protein